MPLAGARREREQIRQPSGRAGPPRVRTPSRCRYTARPRRCVLRRAPAGSASAGGRRGRRHTTAAASGLTALRPRRRRPRDPRKMPDASQRLMPPRASALAASTRPAPLSPPPGVPTSSTPSTAISFGFAAARRVTAAPAAREPFRHRVDGSRSDHGRSGPRGTARGSADAARRSIARHRP